MGTLALTGTSVMTIKPEMTVLRITLKGEAKDYEGAIRKNAERLKELKDIIESNGIKREDIKTLDFNAKPRWIYPSEVNFKKKPEIKGYAYSQILEFKFPIDNMKLSKISYTVSDMKDKPGMSVKFITEREKEYEEQLLAEAMKDAMSKADALKKAGGFKIIGIKEITNAPIRSSYYDNDDYCYGCCFDYDFDETKPEIDIEPRDFELQKSINVVWEIE